MNNGVLVVTSGKQTARHEYLGGGAGGGRTAV